ncbi:MAG: DUF2162 domain-containing protein [Anaerovorax sp.]|nr:DUF2162 domain-containing protein [Anaerovorax sp.]
MSAFGLLTATLILSLKSGLILGMSQKSVKQILFFSSAFAISLGVLVMFFLPMQSLMVAILDKYTFVGSILMALFLIYLGINGEMNNCSTCDATSNNKKYITVLLPCPLCLIALALAVILLGPALKLSPIWLGWITAGVFFLMLLIISFGIRKLMKTLTVDPETILNTFLLFLGAFTLCCSLFIPSLVQSMMAPFSPISLESGRWTLAAITGMFVLLIIGYMKHVLVERKGERK